MPMKAFGRRHVGTRRTVPRVSRLGTLLAASATAAVAVSAFAVAPANAATLEPADTGPGPVGRTAAPTPKPAPGNHRMVDLPTAPSSSTIQKWQAGSPYSAIGVYVDVASSYDN